MVRLAIPTDVVVIRTRRLTRLVQPHPDGKLGLLAALAVLGLILPAARRLPRALTLATLEPTEAADLAAHSPARHAPLGKILAQHPLAIEARLRRILRSTRFERLSPPEFGCLRSTLLFLSGGFLRFLLSAYSLRSSNGSHSCSRTLPLGPLLSQPVESPVFVHSRLFDPIPLLSFGFLRSSASVSLHGPRLARCERCRFGCLLGGPGLCALASSLRFGDLSGPTLALPPVFFRLTLARPKDHRHPSRGTSDDQLEDGPDGRPAGMGSRRTVR